MEINSTFVGPDFKLPAEPSQAEPAKLKISEKTTILRKFDGVTGELLETIVIEHDKGN